MATAYISYHRGVGPSQIQAPGNKISDATPLAISASAANAAAVADACLAEVSTDTNCQVTYGKTAVATAVTGQRLPANAYGYFLWLNAGENVSVIASSA